MDWSELKGMYILDSFSNESKGLLIGKDPDAGEDWRQEEKGTT